MRRGLRAWGSYKTGRTYKKGGLLRQKGRITAGAILDRRGLLKRGSESIDEFVLDF